jgi:uncharacterized membrane protein
MEILQNNVLWMVWNCFLAVLPVWFAFFYLRAKRMFTKGILAIMWLLFLPNSLYVISDMEHIVTQWGQLGFVERIFALIQYAHLEIIGLMAFIFSIYALEKELRRHFKKQNRKLVTGIIVTVNFLTGFAMVMGKIERVNSWDTFTATETVIAAVFNVLSSDHLVWLTILFGLFGNFFYFLLRDPVISYFRKFMRAERLTNAGRVI